MHLIVTNTFEFNRRRLAPPFRQPARRALFSQIHFCLAGLGYDGACIITHDNVSPALLEYWRHLLGYAPNVFRVEPKTGLLSLDAASNVDLMVSLDAWRDIHLTPWGPTKYLRNLFREKRDKLSTQAVHLLDSSDLVDLINCKAANRAVVDDVLVDFATDLRPYPYAIAPVDPGALGAQLDAMLHRWPKVMLKPGLGWAGKGAVVASEGLDYRSLLAHLCSKDELCGGHIVLEPYLGDAATNVCPSADFCTRLPDQQSIVVGQMIMEKYGCAGTIYGRDALPPHLKKKTVFRDFVARTSDLLSGLHYQSWFDVDFLVTEAGTFVSEINVRHSGGSIPILVAQFLLGSKWQQDWCVVCIEHVPTNLPEIDQIVGIAKACMGEAPLSKAKFVVLAHDEVDARSFLVTFWVAARSKQQALSIARQVKARISNS